jgi:FKBP-type peptidyl-prolyl cis-trans isomerase SlyD
MTAKPKVYSFDYVLKDASGKTLDSSQPGQPLLFMEGIGQIIPALEDQIKKLLIGQEKHVALKAAEAYGEMDSQLVFDVPVEQLPPVDNMKEGDMFWGETNEGRRPFKVLKITKTHATMDGNHPLAGQDLFFDVKLVDMRDATEEEVTHGHAHGPGGHHHH